MFSHVSPLIFLSSRSRSRLSFSLSSASSTSPLLSTLTFSSRACVINSPWCTSARGISSTTTTPSQERLAKRLARCGVASRRESELLIEQGKVLVNGKKATMKDNKIVNESDVVTVFGKKIRKSQSKLWVHYKKPEIIVSHKEDESGKTTLFPRLKEIMGIDHIISVGRLDYNSEGLLLLTNDGALARALELPENEIERVYRVRFRGQISPDMLRQLERGPVVEGVRYKPMKVDIGEREGTPANKWVTCTLAEGNNREIRRIFDHFQMPVSRIVRTKFGPYSLTTLAPGDTKQVPISWLGKIIDLKTLYPKKVEDERPEERGSVSERPRETTITTRNIANVFNTDPTRKHSQKREVSSSPTNKYKKSPKELTYGARSSTSSKENNMLSTSPSQPTKPTKQIPKENHKEEKKGFHTTKSTKHQPKEAPTHDPKQGTSPIQKPKPTITKQTPKEQQQQQARALTKSSSSSKTRTSNGRDEQ